MTPTGQLEHHTGLFPVSQDFPEADRNTREFLHRVIDILLDYITKTNDRSTKILDFHHPEQMKQSIDLDIPDQPLNLDQLLVDCKDTMKYGVKTGKIFFINFEFIIVPIYPIIITSYFKLLCLPLYKSFHFI